MKKIGIMAVLALSFSLLLAGSAFAGGMTMGGEGGHKKAEATFFEGAFSAEEIVGMDVQNKEGKTIGSVSGHKADENGQVRFILVSTGGFLGIGEKDRFIPYSAFKPAETANALILTVDENLLASAPAKTPDMTEEGYSRELYEHYGQAPYWGTGSEAMPEEVVPKEEY